jgi:hypothetical protein
MATVHEVVDQDGTCLYRGRDVELACEVYGAAPAGSRLLRRQVWTAEDETAGHSASTPDAPIPYTLTLAGYAATRRASTVDASARAYRDTFAEMVDVSVPYVLPAGSVDLFVVDTTDVGELRRRCPELFVPRPGGAA